MARSRNIKPAFFLSESLADTQPLSRLLFIGLWTVADFNGNLKWSPRRIKIQILPYDDCDIKELACELDTTGCINFYSDGENIFIHIPNFTGHQNPHPNEKKKGTDIPEYAQSLRQVIDLDKLVTSHDIIITGNDKKQSDRADSLFPLTDSLNPKSDTPPVGKPEKPPNCPTKKIVELYNSIANNLPKVRVTSKTMENHISARWRSDPKYQTIKYWNYIFNYCENHEFLSGRSEGTGDRRPFRASLDWIVNPTNFAKINNNKYE